MPSVTRSFRIRAYPNGAQRRMLDQWFGASRWLWNTALGIRSEAYRHCGLKLTGIDLSKWLTQWKRTAGHEWLAGVPATCLTQTLRDQDRAFSNFFAKRARYPRFKAKRTGGALRFQDVGCAWNRGILSLPKLGPLKLAEALPDVAKPDMMTLRQDAAGRYFVSFSAAVELAILPVTGKVIGVDLGLTHLATLSSGEKIAAPRKYRTTLSKLRQQQRCLARRQKASKRRQRQKHRIAKIHARIADQRQYALHQLTTKLVRDFDVIAIEDLNVKAMARGMHARSIHDAAFSEFRRQLTYKAQWYGRTVIACDRFFPSSKLCSRCGHRLDELRLDVRQWTCPKCGTNHDRDVNAAQNLLTDGIRQLAGSDSRDLRAEAEDPCTGETPAQVSADEARSEQIVNECLEHERTI
jgi:putative transposase